MRDCIETFNFIKKYHHDPDATLRGLRVSHMVARLSQLIVGLPEKYMLVLTPDFVTTVVAAC
jgi:hypothetical protein